MDKFNGKYRIPSARHQNWDYARNGAYFITICAKDREHFFGSCEGGKLKLSTIGAIVQGFWYEIPRHFPFVELGEFVVMPNHIHGILIFDKTNDGIANDGTANVETGQCPVSTAINENTVINENTAINDNTFANDNTIINDTRTIGQKRFRNQGKETVSSIVGSYKSICTKHINQAFSHLNFGWQTRFWDNIIKDHEAFITISNYIINNPLNWENDGFFNNE
jgi:putative transposase